MFACSRIHLILTFAWVLLDCDNDGSFLPVDVYTALRARSLLLTKQTDEALCIVRLQAVINLCNPQGSVLLITIIVTLKARLPCGYSKFMEYKPDSIKLKWEFNWLTWLLSHWRNGPKVGNSLENQLEVFSPFSYLALFFLRPHRVEHGKCAEVAAVDWTSVQVAPCRKGLPGADGKRPLCHERGGVSPTFASVWRHTARTPGHMEVR